MTSPTSIVAYLALFAGIGVVFLALNLWIGRHLRPHNPHAEKLEVYECGEPTIGSSFVQFDLRFYVVALLFIIFDVEVAFFFPWANVFGKATHLSDPRLPVAVVSQADPASVNLTPQARDLFREMGIENPDMKPAAAPPVEPATSAPPVADATAVSIRESAHRLAGLSIWDIAVFFAVLMVGFAYVWKRGDLDWVRAVTNENIPERPTALDKNVERTPVLSA